jgi:GT2 family glycosyltransferase
VTTTPGITAVVATRNRRDQLLETLRHHEAPVIVVDNASTDGSPDAVEAAYPHIHVVRLARNVGAAARNIGVRLATTPYVAFADDDSYWQPGCLRRAVELLEAYPTVGLLSGRVLVGAAAELDPVSAGMARAPLGTPAGLPGPAILGFLSCAAVVRRAAFLAVGGFAARLGVYGEEDLLAMDLATASWGLTYVQELTAHHMPSDMGRSAGGRIRQEQRNRLLTAWLRRPLDVAARQCADALRSPDGRAGLVAALRELPWVLRNRRQVPAPVEAARRHLGATR